MTCLEQDIEADMDVHRTDPQERSEDDRKGSMADFDASEIPTDTSLDIQESSEDTIANTTTPDLIESDLSMTDAALTYDYSSNLNIIPSAPKSDGAGASADSSVVQEQALDTAAQKVFATYGLVELIFLELPDVGTISVARCTNKTFQSVIRQSFKIRRRLLKAMQTKGKAVGYAAWLKRRRLAEVECRSSIEPSREDWALLGRWDLD